MAVAKNKNFTKEEQISMKKWQRTILLIGTLALTMSMFTGCIKPYDKPEYVMLEASQTGFLVPLESDTTKQKQFESQSFLEGAKVATKRILIPHRWLQEGRLSSTGRWIPTMRLIAVDRKTQTREWTELPSTGTSNRNQGIVAESRDSIGFMARMNCSAQIEEPDSAKFLYSYNSKELADIIDTDIRAKIESKFVEECAKRDLSTMLLEKEQIMNSIRDEVVPYFRDVKGINITVIGLKGEISYINPEIQKAIDEKFKSSQTLVTQKNENERIVSKAKADAEALQIQASTIGQTLKLKELEIQNKQTDAMMEMAKRWNGTLPQYQVGGNGSNATSFFNIPVPSAK